MIEIVLNGEPKTTSQGQTILGLLRELQLDPARVAVELDRRIVKQPQWPEMQLRAGAQVEIVMFVGGGERAPRVTESDISCCYFGTVKIPEPCRQERPMN